MRFKMAGNKADRIICEIQNGESSATIPRGTPVILNLSATASAQNDGLQVVLPSTAGSALAFALKYGVAVDTYTPNQYGESVLFGVVPYTLITRATRAASSNSWTSSASQASGVDINGIDTLNNAFLTGATSSASLASNGPWGVLLDSLPAFAGSATATTDTRTAALVGARCFVRML